MATALIVYIDPRKNRAPEHRTSSGLFFPNILKVSASLILPGRRGTTSRVLRKQMTYSATATQASAAVVMVNFSRTLSAAVFWNCGATTADSATPVIDAAMDRAP